MSASITYPTLSSTWADAKAEVEQDLADLLAKWGSADDSDFSSSAGLNPTKLSAYYQEAVIQLVVRNTDLAAGLPASGSVLHAIALPGTNGDTAWVATDVSWVCNDTGAGTGAVKVEYGEYDGSGTWTTVAAIGSAITVTNASAANDANDGKAVENGSVSLAYATTARSIALLSSTADATALTAAGSFLSVAVRIRRILQSA